jgi:hypothetical protein
VRDALRSSIVLRCPYCGHFDVLPHDELARALELQRRVRIAAGAVAQLDTTHAALARIFEDRRAFVRVQSGWLATLLAVLAYVGHGLATAPGARVAGALGPIAFVAGPMLGFAVALALGRRAYRRHVRPLLLARPPRAAGSPVRCRACGGDLPDGRDAFTRCPYCGTHNLVTAELALERASLVGADEAWARARAHAAGARTARTSSVMTRAMLAGFGATLAAQVALLWGLA